MADTPRRRLTRTIVVGASAVLVVAALAVTLLWSTGALAQVGGGNTVTPVGVLNLEFGQDLEGGRTYRFPDGSWLIEVPEGMSLWYNSTSESPTGTQHGFKDRETGSLIGIGEYTGEVRRLAAGDDAATANARLDRFEAGFRRPPDWVEPARTVAQHAPRLTADGTQILDEEGVFEGGRTYVIPGETRRLLEAPAGIRFTFSEGGRDSAGGRHYVFWAADRSWHFLAHRVTGRLTIDPWSDAYPEARRLADAVAAAFTDPSPSQ